MDRSLHRPCDHSSSHPRFGATASQEQPIEIAPGVWWVGVRLANDFFSATPMELADQALYAAKEDGRDRVRAAETLSLSSR